MNTLTTAPHAADNSRRRGRVRPQDVDRHVGARIRERRVMLGLTQQQTAELIGVTYQQAHKYEEGINRVAAGRLFSIAQALGVEPGWFFEGADKPLRGPDPQQRKVLALTADFLACDRVAQDAISGLARTLRQATE